MPDFRVIPNAPIDSGHYYNEGLGNESATGLSAAVEGLQQGLDFGTRLTDRVLATRTNYDPRKLAEEQLERELRNDMLEQSIESASIENNINREYGLEAKKTSIDSVKTQTAYTGTLTEGQKIKNRLENTYGDARAKADLASSAASTRSTQLHNQAFDPNIERLKDISGIAKDLGLGKKNTTSSALGQVEGADAFLDRQAGIGKEPGAQSFFPDAPTAAAEEQVDPMSVLRNQIAGQLGNLMSQQQFGEGLNVKKQINTKSFGQTLSNVDAAEGATRSRVAVKKYQQAVTAADDTDFEGQPDYPNAFNALAEFNVLQKKETNPEQKAINSTAIATALKKLGPERTKEFINGLPEKERQNATRVFSEAIVNSGDPELLTDDQKIIVGAGLGTEHAVNPDDTYKKTAQLITSGSASIDDPVFKGALRSSDYIIAARTASKNGSQPYSIAAAISEAGAQGGVSPDVSGQPAPQKVIEFKGADGTRAYAPIPANSKQESELSLVEKTADQQTKTLSEQQKVQNSIAQIKPQQAQPPKEERELIEGAPKVTKKPGRVYNEELGLTFYDNPTPELIKKELYSREINRLADEGIEVDETNKGKFIQKASAQAQDIQKQFNSTAAPLRKRNAEDTEKVEAMKRQVQGLEKLLAKPEIENVVGRGNAWNRFVIEAGAVLGTATPAEKEALYAAKGETAKSVLEFIKESGSVRASDTESEAGRAMLAAFSLDNELVNTEDYIETKKGQAQRQEQLIALRRIGLAQGPTHGVDVIEEYVDKYANSDASKPKRFNVEKFNKDGTIKPGMENAPNIIKNENFLTARQWIGRDPAYKARGSTETTTIFNTSDDDKEAVPGSAGTSPPTNAPAPSGASGGSGSAGISGLPQFLYPDWNGAINRSAETQKTKLLDEREKQDPEFRKQVAEWKADLKKSGDDPGWLDAMKDSITPDFIQQLAEKAQKPIYALSDGLIRLTAGDEAAEASKKDSAALVAAQKEMLEDYHVDHPKSDILGNIVGFASLQGGVSGLTEAGITGLISKYPSVANTVAKLTAGLPYVKGPAKLAQNAVVDIAVNALQTGDYSTGTAEGIGAISAGLSVAGKVLGAIGRPVGRVFTDLVNKGDGGRTLAKRLAEGGTTKKEALEILEASKQQINDAAETGGPEIPVTGYLRGQNRDLIRATANEAGGREAAGMAKEGLEEARGFQTSKNLAESGLDKTRSVEELGNEFTSKVDELVDKKLATAYGKAEADATTSMGNFIKDSFANSKKTATETVDEMTSRVWKQSPELFSKGAMSGSDLQQFVGSIKKDLSQAKEIVDGVIPSKGVGTASYRTAETTYKQLDRAITEEFEDALREQFKGSNIPQKLIDETYQGLIGTEKRTGKLITERMKDQAGNEIKLPRVSNTYAFFENMRQNVKTLSEKGIIKTEAQREKLYSLISDYGERLTADAGADAGFFAGMPSSYGKVEELSKTLDKQIGFYGELEAAFTNKDSTKKLYDIAFGGDERTKAFKAMFGGDEKAIANFQKQLKSYDDAQEVIRKVTNPDLTTTQAGNLPRSVTGIGPNLKEAIKVSGKANFAESLINSGSEKSIKNVTRILGKDRDLVKEGAYTWLKEKTKEIASSIPDNVKDVSIQKLLKLDKQQWKNLETVLGKDELGTVEKFLKQQVNIDLAGNLFRIKGVPGEGFGGMSTGDARAPRRLIETYGKYVGDLIGVFGGKRVERNRAFNIIKNLSDPDPKKVNQYFEEVVSLLEDTATGTRVKDKPVLTEEAKSAIKTWIMGTVAGSKNNEQSRQSKNKAARSDKAMWDSIYGQGR